MPGKPIPFPSPLYRNFLKGTREGKLLLPKCNQCGKVHWYPRYICPHCHSMDLTWIEEVVKVRFTHSQSSTVSLVVGQRMFPLVTAFIDLKEGDRMVTVLRGVDPLKPEEIKIGSKVRVEFEEMEGMFVPFWRLRLQHEQSFKGGSLGWSS